MDDVDDDGDGFVLRLFLVHCFVDILSGGYFDFILVYTLLDIP